MLSNYFPPYLPGTSEARQMPRIGDSDRERWRLPPTGHPGSMRSSDEHPYVHFLGLTRSIRLFILCRQSQGGCRVQQYRGEFPRDLLQLRVAAPQCLDLRFAAGQNILQIPVLAEDVPG